MFNSCLIENHKTNSYFCTHIFFPGTINHLTYQEQQLLKGNVLQLVHMTTVLTERKEYVNITEKMKKKFCRTKEPA